jgi:uncharacterized phage protein gp47/JayE
MIIDENGLQLDSFATIFDNLVSGFKSIYGEDINLDQDTADGQQIGIYTNAIYDLQSYISRIYNSFDPDFAEGHELDKILKLIASTRLPASKSVVDVNITVNNNVTLDSNYTVKDDNEQEWVISSAQTLSAGTTTVSFNAKDWGLIEAIAGSITTPVTILTEVISLSNPTPAVAGRDEETDIDLRKRRNRLIGYRATSLISSLVGKILNLDNVVDCIVYENDSDVYDATKDLNAHTIWIIVDGGEIPQIAEIIATDKTIGCGLKGIVEASYIETFIRGNGTERLHTHIVNFDRPTESNIYIRFDVKKRKVSDIIDIDNIKLSLVETLFNIAEDITATELYATIYSSGTNYIASSLELSSDGVIWVDDILTADFSERLIIVDSQITITEI